MRDNSKISQELLETVERYHDHNMPQSEREAFEERLQNDTEFKTLVDDIQSFLFGIEQQVLKEKLDGFHDEIPSTETQKKASKVRQFQFMKIAAAAVIVIAIGSFWFLSGSSNDRLYDDFFKPDPGLATTMSSSDNYDFYDAMVNYKQGDYKKAIDKWEVLHQKNPENDTLNYFLGVANLAEKNTDKAILFLKETAMQKESVFSDDANYYLGLAHIKIKDFEAAKRDLKRSSLEEARVVLSKIKD